MQNRQPFKTSTALKLGIAVACCVIAAIAFWGFESESDGSKIPQEVIRPVKTILVSQASLAEKRSFPGLVQPSRESKLAFRVGGPLVDLNINIGQHLEKGQIIARVDPRDFEINVMRLEAILGQAQANLKALKTGARSEDIARLKAQQDAARAQLTTAENDFVRQKNLLADRAASKSNYDNARRAFEMAKANMASVTQELKKAQKGGRSEEVEAAEAGLKKLRADLTAARHALEDTRLKAPYSGYVSRKFVENYENVKPGEPIVAFIDISTIEVHVSVPEDVIIRREQVSGIHCTLSAYPGRRFEAVVKEIGRNTDSANQSYPLTVVLEIPKDLVVAPGMAATLGISLNSTAKEGVGYLLPSQAILADSLGKTCVFRIDAEKMTAVKTPVAIGKLSNGTVQILSGLSAGDQVVTAGSKFLRDNQKIRILNAEKSNAL